LLCCGFNEVGLAGQHRPAALLLNHWYLFLETRSLHGDHTFARRRI
jgi:hypothetical protein